jgi:hypothetical protein
MIPRPAGSIRNRAINCLNERGTGTDKLGGSIPGQRVIVSNTSENCALTPNIVLQILLLITMR